MANLPVVLLLLGLISIVLVVAQPPAPVPPSGTVQCPRPWSDLLRPSYHVPADDGSTMVVSPCSPLPLSAGSDCYGKHLWPSGGACVAHGLKGVKLQRNSVTLSYLPGTPTVNPQYQRMMTIQFICGRNTSITHLPNSSSCDANQGVCLYQVIVGEPFMCSSPLPPAPPTPNPPTATPTLIPPPHPPTPSTSNCTAAKSCDDCLSDFSCGWCAVGNRTRCLRSNESGSGPVKGWCPGKWSSEFCPAM
eukprot:TRINITY_DN10853_c0_g1_i1.p1 TRINITY_DN10853_c0_g1~~TRINITY_DN10853_c0_g1_i1.p1  ORF type:complete len:256 (-),score=30.93 TRINITY_DN10853_c0_g1_i1:56-796(-)